MLSDSLKKILSSANSGLVSQEEFDFNSDEADTKARKPGIPILLPSSLCFWAIAAIVYSNHIDAQQIMHPQWIFPIVIILLIAFVISVFFKRYHPIVICLFAVLGLLIGCLGTSQMAKAVSASGNIDQNAQFVLVEDSSKSQFGSSCIAETRDSSGLTIKALLYLDTSEILYRGQTLEGKCKLGDFNEDMRDQYWLQGVSKKGSLKEFSVTEPAFPMNALISIRKNAIEQFEKCCGDKAGILQALVCGYRNTIREDDTYEEFKICGIAHIVAVSGAHLAIVASLLLYVLTRCKMPRKFVVFIEIVFLVMYLVFAGIPISALRATFMVVLSMTSFLAYRRSASLNSLAVCIVVFILLTPSVCVSLSFFLSAGSVLGISVFSPLFRSLLSTHNETFNSIVSDQLSLTISSNVVTLPTSISLFSQLSLISPVANIVAAPLFTLGCVAGLVCIMLSLLVPPLAMVFLAIAALSVTPLSVAVDIMSKVPYASIALSPSLPVMIVLSVVISALLWIFWDRFKMRHFKIVLPIALVVAFLLILIPVDHGDRISMLDVGQGDSFLIESRGAAVLVDTGNKDTLLREALAAHGIKHLDAVIITHPDSDHCESLKSLAGYVNIDQVLVARDLLNCECDSCCDLKNVVHDIKGAAPKGLSKGDTLKVGDFELRVVWPLSFQDEGGNADSLTMLVTCDVDTDGKSDMEALFCGDAESDQLESIMDNGDLCDLDILKVGHHGSKVALDDKLVEFMSPSVALIGVGSNNRYGHPSNEVLDLLDKNNVSVFRSDLMGSVDVLMATDGMHVSCEKQSDGFESNCTIAYD